MLQRILNAMFGCAHKRTTFPQTPRGDVTLMRTRVVCLDCGKEFRYDWASMRRGGSLYVEQAGDPARDGSRGPLASLRSLR